MICVIGGYGIRSTIKKNKQESDQIKNQKENPYLPLSEFIKMDEHLFDLVLTCQIVIDPVKSFPFSIETLEKTINSYHKQKTLSQIPSDEYEVTIHLYEINPAEHILNQIQLFKNQKLIAEVEVVSPLPGLNHFPRWEDYIYHKIIEMIVFQNKDMVDEDPLEEEGRGTL